MGDVINQSTATFPRTQGKEQGGSARVRQLPWKRGGPATAPGPTGRRASPTRRRESDPLFTNRHRVNGRRTRKKPSLALIRMRTSSASGWGYASSSDSVVRPAASRRG